MIYTLPGHAHSVQCTRASASETARASERARASAAKTPTFNCRTNYDKLNAHQCVGVALTHTHAHTLSQPHTYIVFTHTHTHIIFDLVQFTAICRLHYANKNIKGAEKYASK